jgi:hypothetical protein
LYLKCKLYSRATQKLLNLEATEEALQALEALLVVEPSVPAEVERQRIRAKLVAAVARRVIHKTAGWERAKAGLWEARRRMCEIVYAPARQAARMEAEVAAEAHVAA